MTPVSAQPGIGWHGGFGRAGLAGGKWMPKAPGLEGQLGQYSGLEFTCQWKGHAFDPWPEKIPSSTEKLSLQLLSLHGREPAATTGEATSVRSLCTAMKSSPTRRN